MTLTWLPEHGGSGEAARRTICASRRRPGDKEAGKLHMTKLGKIGSAALGAAILAMGAGASAGTAAAQGEASAVQDATFARFAPRQESVTTRIDYALLDAALESFVLRMGRSIREGAPRPDAGIGSRIVYGHDSRFRLEGNRVGFGYLEPEAIAGLTAYRADLESIAGQVDIASLPRNEQLAFWINLHNVAVIEQIALAYPVSQPSRIRLAGSTLPLDETRFISVAGVRMSPRDIRTRIVFPNWNNPKVIYGFFRGEIGGPTIQAQAFTGANVADLLDDSAREFVNSLRGTQESGDTLLVSEIYAEARPFYFADWPGDLKRHLLPYANEEVAALVNAAASAEARIYDYDIADLSKGKPDPGYQTVYSDGTAQRTRISADVIRLLTEREQKFDKAVRRTDRRGTVTVIEFPMGEEPKKPQVVE